MNWKQQDTRPQYRGWAPGGYLRTCLTCEQRFQGDKRAWECADCAYLIRPEVPAVPLINDIPIEQVEQALDTLTKYFEQIDKEPYGKFKDDPFYQQVIITLNNFI